jgi:hypothetical protein
MIVETTMRFLEIHTSELEHVIESWFAIMNRM